MQPQWAEKHLNRHKTPTLRRMSYNSRRQNQVPLLTVKNKNVFLNPLFLSLLFIFIVYSFTYFYLVVCLLPISFYLSRNISLHVIICMMVYVQNQSWICQPQIHVLIWQKRIFSWSHAHPPLLPCSVHVGMLFCSPQLLSDCELRYISWQLEPTLTSLITKVFTLTELLLTSGF